MKLKIRLKGGPGSGHHGHSGRPGKVGGSSTGKGVISSSNIKTRFNIGGDEDTFEITYGDARATGYYRNADFPGKASLTTRGELFFVTAGDVKRQGIGTKLARYALNLMKSKGAKTVNMSSTTVAGSALITKLIREGYISKAINTSKTGKAEYTIHTN